MTAPSITYGVALLYDFPTVGYVYGSTEYSADGGNVGGTTTVDAALTQANDYWNGCYIWYLTGNNAGYTRRITDFDAATDTLTHEAFIFQVVAGDTYRLSTFNSTEDGANLDHDIPVFITDQDDFTITVDGVAGNEVCYHSFPSEATGHTVNLGISSTVNTTAVFRYVTSNASIEAKIELVFNDASTQTILAETASTSHAFGTADITTGKTIDHIRLYANDAAGTVGYDFVMLCKGIFVFPQFGKLSMGGTVHNTETPMINRDTDFTQTIGTGNAKVSIIGDIDHERAGWKRTGDVNAGDVFLEIFQESSTVNFEWFKCDRGSFKVVLDDFDFTEDTDQPYLYSYLLNLSEYSAGTTENVTYSERFGVE